MKKKEFTSDFNYNRQLYLIHNIIIIIIIMIIIIIFFVSFYIINHW